ncbi:hypothetical protein Q0M94_23645 (plasmid) [Deinococcus radiomollis]|uniref:hypothetical protein n=1 Tax=Deinococcus radiomollis TaxID=468916 RepID=UPI0038913DC8
MSTENRNTVDEADTKPWVRRQGDLDDQPIKEFELTSARRALRLLKSKLGRDRLLELLKDEIEEADAFMHQELQRSAGQQASGTVQLHAHGISAGTFNRWLGAAFDREEVMLAAHPEHYVIHNVPGRPHIVETLGDYVCSFFMVGWKESEHPTSQDDATVGRRSSLTLADGTVFGWVSTLFEEIPDGFIATLTVTLPSSCAPELVDQHLEHFAVEFHSWILAAAEQR